MVFELFWFEEEDIEDARKDFSSNVANGLEKALRSKAKQLRWKKSLNELNQRFHNVFSLNGLHIAEIDFSSVSGSYRAICVVLPDEKKVIYFKTVPKKGSHQKRVLELIEENSEDIREFIRRKADRLSS